ncbi:dipeptidase [Nocardioides lentus]|uniref:Dipeptidase n=1 Tax=Nocardioides lentus TaxID=338077 RepID=A0ABN2P9N9_9ACTN
MTSPADVETLRARLAEQMPRLRADLEDLVRIESVSADPARAGEVRRSAEATAALLRGEGIEDVRIVAADGGAPAVIARRPGPPGAPTVLLYAHHDVQPEGDHAAWGSPPFEPTERDSPGGRRLFGRGAADDKAGIAAHLGALRLLGDELAVGVTVFVEGEEEVGSETLPALLAEHREALAADVIVIADSTNWDVGVPALTTSLRGLVRADVTVRTLTHGVHSGMWGGLVPDALIALSRLLATLHDDTGDVAVAGLHTGPAADVDYPEERLRAESGVAAGVDWIGTGSAVERLWTRPALSVTGLDAPAVDGASNTLVPAARAKISMRIAPGDTAASAAEALTAHLHAHAPWGAQVDVRVVDTGEPIAIHAEGPAYDVARGAFADAWDGVAPVDLGVGGSIPFIAEFLGAFPDAAVLVTGVEDPDTRAHGADEGLHLEDFARVVVAEALLLARLADGSAPTS